MKLNVSENIIVAKYRKSKQMKNYGNFYFMCNLGLYKRKFTTIYCNRFGHWCWAFMSLLNK